MLNIILRMVKNMSFGLALAGGGAKGAAHVGVLKALTDNNLFPSSIAGTSAGSIVAGLYAAGFTPNELEKIVLDLSIKGIPLLVDPNYKGLIKAITQLFTHKEISLSGVIKGDKLEKYLDNLLHGKTINSLKLRTVIPTVDLNSGKTVVYTNNLTGLKNSFDVIWKNTGKLSSIIRASSSVPAVFEPTFLDNMCLVDGGVTDVLPVDLLIQTGENNVIAVDISKDYKKPKHYNIFEIASHSFHIMHNCICKYEESNELLAIKPNLPEKSGLLVFSQMEECMKAGYDATIKMLPTIKKYL